MSLLLLRLSQKLRRCYSRRRKVGRVSNVNRARSLENSFPRRENHFRARRRSSLLESRQMAGNDSWTRARYSYISGSVKKLWGRQREVISDLISKPERKNEKDSQLKFLLAKICKNHCRTCLRRVNDFTVTLRKEIAKRTPRLFLRCEFQGVSQESSQVTCENYSWLISRNA